MVRLHTTVRSLRAGNTAGPSALTEVAAEVMTAKKLNQALLEQTRDYTDKWNTLQHHLNMAIAGLVSLVEGGVKKTDEYIATFSEFMTAVESWDLAKMGRITGAVTYTGRLPAGGSLRAPRGEG